MRPSAEISERTAYVTAALNYVVPTADRLFTHLHETPPGIPRTNGQYESRMMQIHDIRPFADGLSLDREGIMLARQPSRVSDFYDDDEIRRVYYGEAERLIASATGAARVVAFDFARRRRVPGARDRTAGLPRQPATVVHSDYTVKSGPRRVRDLMGAEAEHLERGRVSIVNLWRPIRGPLLDAPLAMIDATSIADQDLIAADLIYPDRRGEHYRVAFNPSHRWLYAPAMEQSEALLFKSYDSRTDGTARFVAHSAFTDPTTPAAAPLRESIELRALVFHRA